MTTTDWIQAISMLVLVVVTGIYAWRTYDLSKSAKMQADASVKMAEDMREQRYDAARPVIDIQVEPSPREMIAMGLPSDTGKSDLRLSSIIHNIGSGPAIDVHCLPTGFVDNERNFDFGPLGKDQKTKPVLLPILTEQECIYVAVCYKDIFGRDFKSTREVFREEPTIGPLKITLLNSEVGK